MKKFIAVLLTASVFAAPVAFAADEAAATPADASAQQMTSTDQAAPAAKPAKKAHHAHHCATKHKHHHHTATKAAPVEPATPAPAAAQ
jgi:Ni/Co efflux regulator RcnB